MKKGQPGANNSADWGWALTRSTRAIDPSGIIELFQHYMKQECTKAERAEFIRIVETHLQDSGFYSDMEPLLHDGISCDPQAADKYAKKYLPNLPPA